MRTMGGACVRVLGLAGGDARVRVQFQDSGEENVIDEICALEIAEGPLDQGQLGGRQPRA